MTDTSSAFFSDGNANERDRLATQRRLLLDFDLGVYCL